MRILRYKASLQKTTVALLAALLVVLTALFSSGCNQDGVGIYYSISQEEKQITSKISEVNVYNVVEIGGTLYALGGRTVWRQSGSDWSDLGGGFAYNIVSNDGSLFAFFNKEDLDGGRIKEWDGSNWQTHDSFSDKGKLIDIGNNTHALVVGGTSSPELYLNSDLSTPTVETNNDTDIDFYIVDGTFIASKHYLISASKVFSCDSAPSLTDLVDEGFSINGTTSKSGDLAAITAHDGTLYAVTTEGQVFKSSDPAASWDYLGAVDGEVYSKGGAAEVVNIGSTDPDDYYLIIGTHDGYYEMNLGTEEISEPTVTASTADGEGFAASYPDLNSSLVHQVYQSSDMSTDEEFYLATENGLWKRTATGEFERQ